MTSFSWKNSLLVLRFSRLGRIPPALAAVEVLAEAQIPTCVIEFGRGNDQNEVIEEGFLRRRYRACSIPGVPDGVKTLIDVLLTFCRLSIGVLKEGRPRLVFSHGLYEQWLAYLLYRTWGIPYVAAVHEVLEPHELSRLNRWFLKKEGKCLRSAEFLIFPEANRARFYQQRYGLLNRIHIVFNCPRLRLEEPLSARANWKLPATARVVGYLGGIGRDNFIEETIAAVLPLSNVYFFYWGWGDEDYLEHLRLLAQPAGDRICWMGTAAADKWSLIAGWDVGLCLYRAELLRLKMAATASNKLFECLSVGCPVLTSGEKDFRAFLSQFPVGVSATQLSAEGICHALESLFSQELDRVRRGEKGRELYLNQFHFEAQFRAPLEEFKRIFSESGMA